MKMADILRDMADMLDQKISSEHDHNDPAAPGLTPVEVDNHDDTESVTMVPPLQQKLELLKKATGVDNHFDGAEEGPDELDRIKHLGGVAPAAVIHVASDNSDAE